MTNHYETPEVVEMGRAKNLIMGEKLGIEKDPITQEDNWDIELDEIE